MSIYIIIWDIVKVLNPFQSRYLAFTPVNNLMMGYDDTIQAIINTVQATEFIRISPVLNYCQRDIMSQEKGIK